MILSNTVTSAAVAGTTVQAAADDNPILGFSAVGNGRNWVGTPGVMNGAVNNLGTLATGTTNIDWTAAGIYTLTCYGGAMTFQFATTATASLAAASQVLSPSLGQTIMLIITGAGSAAITWPTTISWVGEGTSGAGVHTAPTVTSVTTVVYLTCTAVGSAPTYLGLYITG